jgi:hypothetical protein
MACAQSKNMVAQPHYYWFPKPTKNQENKGKFFVYWGYNRSKYLKSNIHFSSPDYDFTVYDVKGTDRQRKFSLGGYFKPANFSIPQYNYRLGYFMNDRWVISGGLDHMKYVVTQDQRVRISGVVSERISPKYAGAYLLDSIALAADFLQFEHTNGLNLITLDFEYLQPIAISKSGNFKLKWNIGLGGIWVVTKTDVRVMGDGIDNDFHVAGFSLAAKTGPRFDFFKRFFLATEFKAAYMAIPDVLIENAAPKHADHTLIVFEGYFAVGTYFQLWQNTKH